MNAGSLYLPALFLAKKVYCDAGNIIKDKKDAKASKMQESKYPSHYEGFQTLRYAGL